MLLRIHHLNCGTMCPVCARFVFGAGTSPEQRKMICHCLLLETSASLVLVDTGFGMSDVREPKRRVGSLLQGLLGPRFDPAETAIEQIKALGFDPRDVRHIIPTHLDVDHVGGLSDFPEASVHVYAPELAQIQQPTLRDRLRFHMSQFEHNPRWVVHHEHADQWFGFDAIEPIAGLASEVRLVPLIGHTRGHLGVAVKDGKRWLLHCGDAYFHHSQVTKTPDVPVGLQAFELAVQTLPAERRHSQQRLRQLVAAHGDEVELFCAHDAEELARYTSRAASA